MKIRELTKKSVAALVSIALLVTLVLLKNSASVSEWIAINLSRKWVAVFGRIFSIIPFSVYELGLYTAGIAVLAVAVVLVKRLAKRQYVPAVSLLLATITVVFSCLSVYTLSAGFNYNRSEISLPGKDYALTDQEVRQYSQFFMDDFNYLSNKVKRDENGIVKCPYSFDKLNSVLQKEFKKLGGGYVSRYTPRGKKILSSWIMSQMHFTGVFFAPYGEVNVNAIMPDIDLPVTLAHEMAHAKGVMREDEANMIAYYLTCGSDDEYIRYCGYSAVISRVLSAVHFDDDLRGELYSSIDQKIRDDFNSVGEFWSNYNLFSKISNFFNNLYLKLQGVKDGTGSYVDDDVIIDVPVEDGSGNIVIESRYIYSDLQKTLYFLLKERATRS